MINNPHEIYSRLLVSHSNCEDQFVLVGSIIDNLYSKLKISEEDAEAHILKSNMLSSLFTELTLLESDIQNYKKLVEDLIVEVNKENEIKE